MLNIDIINFTQGVTPLQIRKLTRSPINNLYLLFKLVRLVTKNLTKWAHRMQHQLILTTMLPLTCLSPTLFNYPHFLVTDIVKDTIESISKRKSRRNNRDSNKLKRKEKAKRTNGLISTLRLQKNLV